MQIELIEVKKENKGKYVQAEIAYKNLSVGKIEGKKLVSFKYPEVFNAVVDAPTGAVFNVKTEKLDGYWQWVEVIRQAPGASGASVPANQSSQEATRQSNFETPEERAKKQVYIIKQSCLERSIDSLSVGAKSAPDRNAIIELAQFYVDWVLSTTSENLFDLPNDLPE